MSSFSLRNLRTTLGQILNINTWQDHRPSNLLIKEHNQHNLAQVIGAALDRIGTYNDLDNKQHVIALIDPEMCINCGEPPFLSSSFAFSLAFVNMNIFFFNIID